MRIVRYVALSVFSLCVLSASFAQQDPQFSQNVNNRLYVNPAYSGMNDAICAYFLGRQQWVGFEGHPESNVFGVHGTFQTPLINMRSGGGLTILSDRLGQQHHLGIKGSYSLHIPLNIIGSDPGYLGVGFGIGMLQLSLGNNWRAVDAFFSDPGIPDNGFSKRGFDFDLGAYYQTENGLFFGISATHLTQTKFEDGGEGLDGGFADNPDVTNWNISYEMATHYYLMGGYEFPLPGNPLYVLKPSVFVKSDARSSQVDLNMLVEYNSMFWGGLTYRYIDAVVLLGGINLDLGSVGIPAPGGIRFGYSYDITTSRIATGSTGSHEVFLQYCLRLKKPLPVQKHKSPRFL